MMQSYARMILDELDESNEKLWVFKGEFLMIFLLKYFLSEKYAFGTLKNDLKNIDMYI